ncbi:hypothetical protein HPB51_003527 [Rhipicephalus microplus]|uniref:Uncharacterized protein n=1 Tax=Rhipicephalus microplus TaxID=6941 RepID=A0A9J6D810_RHIMP|nr:hypothetical protein HPB51_003527 [Rhipicephalus microplus]
MTVATKSRLPLRPTCYSNLGALPPLRDRQSFVAERTCDEITRKTDEAVVASTADAAARRHRGFLERQDCFNIWRTSWRGPQWVSSTGTEHANHENVTDMKVAVARRLRYVATTNTWCLLDQAAVNWERLKAFATYFPEKTTTKKTCELPKAISSDTLRTGANTRHCAVTPACDVGIKQETPKPKTPRLELEFQAVGPVDACEVNATCTASSRFRKLEEQGSTMRRPTDRSQVPRAHSVKYACVLDAKKVLPKSRPSVLANVP